MAGQDIKKRIAAGGVQNVNVGGDYIYLKFADRPVNVVITGGRSGGTKVTMEAGDKYRPGSFQAFEVENTDPDNPAQVIFTVGEGDYNRQIIQGEVTVTPGLRKADGSYVPDTRHDITLDVTVTDDQVKTWSKNQVALTETLGSLGYDGNWSVPVADEKYLYFLTPSSSGPKFTVLDLHTLEVVADHEHNYYNDGVASIKNAVIHAGRVYATVKSTGSTWKGGDPNYDWWGIVSWSISPAGLGGINVHADDWPNFGTVVASVLRNEARNSWLVQRDDKWREVATLSKSAIDAANNVMLEAPSSYADSLCFYIADENRIWADGQEFDAETLEHIGSRGIGPTATEQGIAYSPASGLFYLADNADFEGRSWEGGNKWAGAVHVVGGCRGGRRTRKKGTVLRLPVSYTDGEWGPVFDGPLIKAALHAYQGEEPPADYMDHVYKLVLSDGLASPRSIVTGSETFDRAKVADDFELSTPATIVLTIDNQLFNGESQ